jgi:hypothetical protein
MWSGAELLVSECTALEAISRTWTLGSGQRLRMIGYILVSTLIVVLGAIACCVGMIPAVPIYFMLFLSLFLALRKSSSLPTADHL